MTYRLGWLVVSIAMAIGCESERLDPTERALADTMTSLRRTDAAVEDATGFSFFGRLRDEVEEELPYRDGRWVFPTPQGSVAVGFSTVEGEALMLPDDATDAMEIVLTEGRDVDELVDVPGDHRSSTRITTSTHGLTTTTPAILAAYGIEHAYALDGVDVSIVSELSAEVTFGGPCPAGEISGLVTATARAPLEHEVSRDLELTAHYDGNELTWEIRDGDVILESGTQPTAAPHC